MTETEYIQKVFMRISRGNPQAIAGVYRPAIQISKDDAIQRLANSVARDKAAFQSLQRDFALVLVGGEVSLSGLTPELITAEYARKNWYIRITGADYPVEILKNRASLDNPPPTEGRLFAAYHSDKLIVVNHEGVATDLTAVTLSGNYIPSDVTDTAFNDTKLADELINFGVQVTLSAMAGA
jgi:hypothetical protein